MRIKKRVLQKIVSVLSSFLLLINSFTPYLLIAPSFVNQVKAQEATVSPTPDPTVSPAVEVTPEPTVEPTVAPTIEPTTEPTIVPTVEVSPTIEVTPEVSPTGEPTPVITTEVTPEVTPTVVETPLQSVEESTPTPNPLEVTNSPSPPSPTPTEAISTPAIEGVVETTLVESYSCRADSLNGCLITDKADYAPTDAAVITGHGFAPTTIYTLRVTSSDAPAVDSSYSITTDANGSFTYSYQLDGNYRPNYLVELKDSFGFVVASVTFTDSATPGVDLYDQCSNDNGSGYSTGDTGCRWINGNLQGSNSTFYEGDSTPQRLAIQDLSTGDYTVSINYATTKGGKHAYDFITDDVFSENWITNSDFCDSPIGHLAGCSSLTPISSGLIPTDPNAEGHDVATTARHFKIRNGTWVGSGILSGPTLTSGDYTGDSSTTIQLQFHVDTNTCSNKYQTGTGQNKIDVCEVVITWGAHVSSQSDWGVGNSSVNIPGSPYHVALVELNGGSIGSRDNQMQADAIIPPSTINIHKVTSPTGGIGFGYTTTGLIPSTFNLNDGGTQTFLSVIPGQYFISEDSPTGYTLTGLTCNSSGTGTSATTNIGARTISINIGAAGGGNVDCTFTNTVQNGSITVTKQTTPDGSPQSFTFNLGGNATDSASLTDGQSHTFGDLLPGSYSLGEIIPSGWQFTSATCDNNNFSNDGTISLSPAQNVSCVFNNTQLGTMKVKKVMVGDTGSFTFTGDVAGTISTNNGEITVNNVVPGSYSSIESAISGWDLTGISCDDANSTGDKSTGTASFKVEANETVTCTFTNTKKRDITACKFDDMNGNGVKDDGDSLLDGWDMTLTPGDVTQSTVSGCTTFSDLLPGQYSIAETLKTDWLNTTDLSQNVTLTANQNEKIYFGNFQCATISGTKWEDLNGNGVKDSGEPTLPDWTINLGGQKTNSTTTNADGNYSFKVCNGGSYTISEDFPNTDWYQTYPGGTSPNHQVTVTSGGSYTGKDFGNAKYAKISGIKYRDNDGDGVLDANDLTDTLAGWVFDLYDGVSNAVLSTYTTLANGFYEFTGLFAGHSYYVKEQQKTGWTQTIGSPSPTPMTLQSGDDKKVNFANYENVSIKVCKEEDRDGDIRSSDDRSNVQGWSMTLYDNAVQVGSAQVTGTDGCYTWSNLGPGNYSVSEETRTGWTNLNNTSHGFGTLQSGSGESSWTFVNSRLGKVIVKKVMIGGTDTFDFTGDALGSIGTNNGTIELDNVIPGSDPASVESAKAGWDLTNITCDDTDSIPDLPTRTVIFRVGSGETVTCTFTNSKLPTLTLTKTVVNNNGGTAIANDFQGKINGDNVSWSTAKTLTPGSYTASETTLSNYTASEWGTDCNANGNITLAYGDNKTCSITNNDNAPALHLRKTITNDNGGTATVDDFTLTANGTGTNDISGTSPVDSDATLKADTFALSESSLAGYTAGSWDCGRATMTDPTHVVVPFGGDVTCTLNNNDDAPSLTLVKEVEGGSNEPADWTLTADGPTGFSGTGPTVDNGTSFDAGTYNLSESGPSGYTASNWVCTGGNQTDGDTVVIGLGENVTCTITNTRDIGSLEVNKQVDTNGDGVFEGGNTEANGLGFVWGIDSEIPARSMGSTASSLDTGSYNVNENNDVANYHFVGWFYNGSDFSCEDPENSELPALINVSKGSTTSITLCNARDMGTITVDKVTDPSEAPDEFTINLSQGLLENPTLIHSSVLADQTTPDTYTIPTGEYWFQELAKTGWDLTDATCTDGEESFDPRADSFNLTTDVNLTCTFTNTQRGKVIVTKYSDNNGNGQRDEGENTLSDWVINFNKNSQTTDNNGQTIFNNVVPGTYDLSETMKDGYIQTELSCFDREFRGEDNLLSVRVGPGSDIDCQIGNQPINPKLQISKSNNGVDNSRGGSVIYTLIVNALDGKVLGVKVKDLLPKGFNFQNVISIIRTNSVNPLINDDITALVGDPLYHSPGTYNLGDMNQDDIITIKYQAMIDGSQAYGLYKDIAWAEGTNLLGTKVLASAQDGKVDDYFVGTSVRINGNLTQEGKIEGEVLGASTSLPATGANPAWLIIALMLTIFGALTVALGFMFKKGKMILTILTLFAGSLLIVNSTYAADVSIRLSEPKTPTRINNFTVDFVALDLSDSGNPLTVKCFYKKNLGDGWTQYGPDITVAAPGNNGSCQEVSSIVNTSEKTYYFKATVNGIDSETTVAVGYDDRDPSVPTNFSKEKIGDCQYKVTFKTADDGQTSRVEVYRSSSTSFNLDGGTRVADISIGPNTEGSFTDSVPDCSKTYYYVVRAFNSAGNASGSNGDSVTVSSSSTATTSITEGGAIPVVNVTLPAGGKEGEGSVLGEETKEGSKAAEEVINVNKPTVTGSVKGVFNYVKTHKKISIGVILGLGIIGYGIYAYKKRKQIAE